MFALVSELWLDTGKNYRVNTIYSDLAALQQVLLQQL